ncbi:TetR/AcrR family transcriptional regulator [Actinacidiphila soli]|uniref:TetR/AcrR family transcriptional regulator n=1 Tax=Actinacidiphila soli TaxID=2487275 RepID=UPI000FCBDBBF|nr:TetR/AcrR family transcriptional regulator [Actinacidiphila soli]
MPDPASTPTKRRADAERNVTAILDAALECFGRSPDAPMTEVAKAAGVSRVTLYAHFTSREALLDALLQRTIAEIDAALEAADLDHGPPQEAVARLMHAPWLLVRFRGLYAAAVRHLGAEHVHHRHDPVLARIDRLIARGQDEGAFRTDLPRHWLGTAVYNLAHAVIAEVKEGHLTAEEAPAVVTASLISLLGPA